MDKKQKQAAVSDLIKNGFAVESDRAVLEGLSEQALGTLCLNAGADADSDMNLEDYLAAAPPTAAKELAALEAEGSDPVVEAVKNGSKEVQPQQTQNKEQTDEEYLASLPPRMRSMVSEGLAIRDQQKEQYITAITSNAACTMKPEFLREKDLGELQALAQLAQASQPAQQTQNQQTPSHRPLFTGAAGVAPVANAAKGDEEPLTMPTINWAEGKDAA